MENKKEHIERLQMVIRQSQDCDSTWGQSAPVRETFNVQTVRDGEVAVFSVTHPKAKEAYTRPAADGNFTAVLGIPSATDPVNAVKVSIVAASKKRK